LKVLPTLNIQNGRIVPALENGPATERSPVDVIEALLDLGCCRFALVDVDAARGTGSNREILGKLIRRIQQSGTKVCIQVGGGICSSDHAQHYMNLGATWLLVGTVLHRYPTVVDQMLARFQDHLIASVDARGGEVQIDGRREARGVLATSMAEKIRERGFKRLLFADIPVGEEVEPDFQTAKSICERARIPVFMGGSIRSQEHLTQAEGVRGLQGVLLDVTYLLDSPKTIMLSANPCA
jgi:phosphoribosylformimino-5-aminoimidazole carboxamide ribonucleotide (ProFAR) isomerase